MASTAVGGADGDTSVAYTDPELRPDLPCTDLHYLRAADPALDKRCSEIQINAAAMAVERIQRDDVAYVEEFRKLRVLVTGSAGYIGAALCMALKGLGSKVVGMDIRAGATVDIEADVADPVAVQAAVAGCDAVLHTAALHAPHAAHHSERRFMRTNVIGTQNILDAVAATGACLVHTSTTSLTITKRVKSLEAAGSLVWIDEMAQSPVPSSAENSHGPLDAPRNKYGRTKLSAERCCVAAAVEKNLPVIVLRISRCFPEDVLPSSASMETAALSTPNLKANELLGRRVALVDVLDGHLRALSRCRDSTVRGMVLTLSAPWPWSRAETPTTATDVLKFVHRERPELSKLYSELGWSLLPFGRVYDSSQAMKVLGWHPAVTFDTMLTVLLGASAAAASDTTVAAKGGEVSPVQQQQMSASSYKRNLDASDFKTGT